MIQFEQWTTINNNTNNNNAVPFHKTMVSHRVNCRCNHNFVSSLVFLPAASCWWAYKNNNNNKLGSQPSHNSTFVQADASERFRKWGGGYKFVRTLYNLVVVVKVVCLKFWHKPHLWLGGTGGTSPELGGYNVPPVPIVPTPLRPTATGVAWSVCVCVSRVYQSVCHDRTNCAKYDHVGMSVSFARLTQKPHSEFYHISGVCCLFLLWRSCDMLCTSGFVDNVWCSLRRGVEWAVRQQRVVMVNWTDTDSARSTDN